MDLLILNRAPTRLGVSVASPSEKLSLPEIRDGMTPGDRLLRLPR
jgi:hypothetical protein